MLVSILLTNVLGDLWTLNLTVPATSWKGVFPDKLKIAKVTPIFKAGDSSSTLLFLDSWMFDVHSPLKICYLSISW